MILKSTSELFGLPPVWRGWRFASGREFLSSIVVKGSGVPNDVFGMGILPHNIRRRPPMPHGQPASILTPAPFQTRQVRRRPTQPPFTPPATTPQFSLPDADVKIAQNHGLPPSPAPRIARTLLGCKGKGGRDARKFLFKTSAPHCLYSEPRYALGVKKHKNSSADPELTRQILELIKTKGGGHNEAEVADIIENALKLLTDVKDSGDVRVIQTALRELRYAFRIFAPYAAKRKVTIFGSARTSPSKPEYQQAVDFGKKMAAAGYMVITGAGPGIMQAGHEGAGPENSFGVNIRLPWEQSANPVIAEDKKLITFKYFFTRKLIFIRHSDAIALFPGGFGTMDEGYEAITLMQTGKSQLMPLVLIDRPGGTYWKTWDKNIREHLLRDKLISPDDLNLYQITDNADEATKIITRFYRNFHSTRWVKDALVIRLKNTPSPSAIAAMNEDFADIINGEPIKIIAPTPEEVEDNAHLDLVRIAFGFNRKDYGRLRQLIDVLNSL
jgi:uncharacterized protein (TIGR00730 family)